MFPVSWLGTWNTKLGQSGDPCVAIKEKITLTYYPAIQFPKHGSGYLNEYEIFKMFACLIFGPSIDLTKPCL